MTPIRGWSRRGDKLVGGTVSNFVREAISWNGNDPSYDDRQKVLDLLLADCDPQELFAKYGLLDELKKALSERMLAAELDDHLENEGAEGALDRRNGSSRKTVLTDTSKVTLVVLRDRAGTFDPKLIAKGAGC